MSICICCCHTTGCSGDMSPHRCCEMKNAEWYQLGDIKQPPALEDCVKTGCQRIKYVCEDCGRTVNKLDLILAVDEAYREGLEDSIVSRLADANEKVERYREAFQAMLKIDELLCLSDNIYDVREREGEGWEGPNVKAYSDALQVFAKAKQALDEGANK